MQGSKKAWNRGSLPHVLAGLLVSAVLAVSGGSEVLAQSGAGNAPGLVTIRVAGSDAINSAASFFVAQRQGFFKEAGLDVVYVTMSGGAAPMSAALKAGEVDLALGGASQYMSDIARGVVSGKLIGEITDNNNIILGGNGITDVKQLKGKVFGISSFNAGDHFYVQAVLAHYGIGPDDLTWLPVGTPVSRLAALESGRVDGVELVSVPDRAKSRILVGADDSPVNFVSNALFARVGFLEANRPALRKFLAAIGKGADFAKAHPDEAVPACQLGGGTAADCKLAIEVAAASKNPFTWSSTSRLNTDAIKAMIPAIAAVVPQAKTMTVSDFADTSLAP